MGKLLDYSGTTTKIRAMQSRLLTEDEYRDLAGMKTVTDALIYLKKKPGYAALFSDQSEGTLHRNEIEDILTKSVYADFQKLYRFAPAAQRKFLRVYFGRYETAMLKSCMRLALDHLSVTFYAGSFQEFFEKHSDIDFEKLLSSRDMNQLLDSLRDTMYYEPLLRLSNLPNPTLFDYGTALDIFYFKWLWEQKDSICKDEESKQFFMDAYGTKSDLLNIQWIYRSKNYFHMKDAQIYALLIPVQYRLKQSEITALVEAGSLEDFTRVLKQTWYGRHFDDLSPDRLSAAYVQIRHKIQTENVKKNPYSVATVISYLFEKEHEIDRVTTALEGIRYGLAPEEIYHYIKY